MRPWTATIADQYAPNAEKICLIGVFSDWKEKSSYRLNRINQYGDWEINLPFGSLKHGDLYKLSVHWSEGRGERIPSYATRLLQDETTKIFSAQVWCPEEEYKWKIKDFEPEPTAPVIYEAHIGMSTPHEKVGSYSEFTENVLPIIAGSGYNTIQLMAIQEHPFYGSFGYHVSSFFAASSRFGTPEELKELIDTAHESGIRVIMDLVHSHSVKNLLEGLVEGKNIVIVDDMVDTAGTIAFAAGMMKSEGALTVRVVATHPVLSGPAYERIEQSPIDELIVTDTIPLKGHSDKIKVISVAEHFAEVIDKVYNFKSISDTYIR